jgi:glycosyltransferase involved in cell wall biosynthesis
MPKVLMIAYHFPPIASGGVRRTVEFVRHLPEHGWKPLVLTIDPKTSHYKSDPKSISVIPEGTDVVRTATREPLWAIRNLPHWHLGRLIDLLMPIDRSVTWVGPAVRAGLRMIKEHSPDVIYTSSTPYSVHLIGWALHRLTGKPWVADWRDLWTHSVTFQAPTPLHRWLNYRLERRLWHEATVTVTHSNGHRNLIQRDFPELSEDRLVTILMGYDPEQFDAVEATKYDRFAIVYAGTFYGVPVAYQMPEAIHAKLRYWLVHHVFDRRGVRYLRESASPLYFLQALRKALDTKAELSQEMQVDFLGFPRPGNVELIKQMGLEGIVQHIGQVSFEECVSRMKGADVLLLVMLPSESGRSDFVPSKVPEYLGARRPILAMMPKSEVREMIKEARAGITVGATDVDAAKDTILELYQHYKEGSLALEANASALRELTWPHLTEQMANVLNRAADSQEDANAIR